ncbi:hypothetical protein [Salipiger mucosus]|uniref:Uncharacterized protein n=1 Tax=Salipiger mucosus DSM 16094 TaxID=1123237 RepID=S9QWL7_9RHOB|nr:hypothetical protein [Salipiger mucosus]EPX84003.1 hypothetical protein Salmuc_01778 [Salipiger mucosus DSM 16094]
MISLDISSLAQWYAKLPNDFQKAIKSDLPDPDREDLKALSTKLAETELADLKTLLEGSTEELRALGRIGRIRLLAAITAKTYPYQVKVFKEITEAEDSEGGGHSETQVLFIEDIKAFNEAVAARVYTSNLDSVALSALNDAAIDQAPDIEPDPEPDAPAAPPQ